MTGLMLGSLRALWPWQDDDGIALAPDDDLGLVLLLVVVGASVVLALITLESLLLRRRLLSADVAADPQPEDVNDSSADYESRALDEAQAHADRDEERREP